MFTDRHLIKTEKEENKRKKDTSLRETFSFSKIVSIFDTFPLSNVQYII